MRGGAPDRCQFWCRSGRLRSATGFFTSFCLHTSSDSISSAPLPAAPCLRSKYAQPARFLTFWPTEFSQIRGQFRRINFAGGEKGNEFLMQFNFSIGAHGAHLF